jgi:two-component system phosphate regulon sensor histidine kinase PhoR
MNFSIRWRWILTHLVVGGLVLLFVFFYLRSVLTSQFEERFESRLKKELALATSQFSKIASGKMSAQDIDVWADEVGAALDVRVTIIDSSGKVLGDSVIDSDEIRELEDHGDRPEVIDAIQHGYGRSRRFSATMGLDLFYFAQSVHSASPVTVVRLAVLADEVEQSLVEIRRLIWISGGVGFALVIIVGLITSRSIASRMEEMTEAAERFAQGDFTSKITLQRNDELANLGGALNRMASDLKSSIGQITRERDQLQAILNSMVEGVLVTDINGFIILFNRSFLSIFKYAENIVGKPTRDILRNIQFQAAIERALKERKDVIESIEIMRPARKFLEAYVTIMGAREKPSGLVVVFHDVTQLRHLEQVRRDFVANVSHELRTPLTAIKGYAETLLDGGVQQVKSEDFLRTIVKHSDRMSKLVEDLLILSRLESIQKEEQPGALDLKQIIPVIANSFKGMEKNNGLQIIIEVPRDLAKVKGLHSEIETVVQNLIDNAIKYGAQGKEVKISAVNLDDEVQVSIADKGMGIPIEEQPRIFERFYRVDKGRSRALGGTGLGLSIVKHIILRHHGRLWVDSSVGKGATFSFTLPKA